MIDPLATVAYPLPLDQYPDPLGASVFEVLVARFHHAPFNAVATGIFALAVAHTFLTHRFIIWAHHVQDASDARCRAEGSDPRPSVAANLLHLLGEVEIVFGVWAAVLMGSMAAWFDWNTGRAYLETGVNFTEPVFVVVVMAVAATRPVVEFAEAAMQRVAAMAGGSPAAWWLTVLTLGPVLGSLITEPAAMTICALVLGRQFYGLGPSVRLKYATLGLLFVNVSIGGTLTHFAAPPVLMVARPWDWSLGFMAGTFGWKAVVAILASNAAYYLLFRREFAALAAVRPSTARDTSTPTPPWIVTVHFALLAFVVAESHYLVIFVGAFLFFLGFLNTTAAYQTPLDLKPPMLVGFFLAGLVTHGGLQGWWIEPVLGSLSALTDPKEEAEKRRRQRRIAVIAGLTALAVLIILSLLALFVL